MADKEVFVTYSWDNDEHSKKVIAFTDFLRRNGFAAEVDRMLIQEESAIDFKKMMHKAMTDYKKVIVVLSEGYKKKAEDFEGGVGNEYSLILSDFDVNKDKYVFVSFEGINSNITPLFFRNKEIIDLKDTSPSKEEKLFRKLMDIEEFSFSPVSEKKPQLETKPIPALFHNSDDPNIEYLDYNQNLDLVDFASRIQAGEKSNIIKLLNLSLNNFVNASVYIEQNENDVLNGVKEVYVKDGISLFGVFDTCVIKVLENGDKHYFLYTTTKDVHKIIDVFENLSLVLGIGIYDDLTANSFQDISKVRDIANGYVASSGEECHAMWAINKIYTLWLTYHVTPLQQLAIFIKEKKIIERPNIRLNNSILEHMPFKLEEVIHQSTEIYREIREDEVIYVEYKADLPQPFLEIFTNVKIRIFGMEKRFNKEIQTHLFFYTKNNIFKVDDIKIIASKLWNIYGEDNNDYGVLQDYELKNAVKYRYWDSGRSYHFDKAHRMWNKNSEGIPLYQVEVEYSGFSDEGLCLTVIAFNELVKYMEKAN